jgi:hypothetical protein
MPVKRFNKSKRLKMGGRRNSKRLKMGGRRKSKRLKMGGRRKSKRLNKSKRFVRDGSVQRLKIGGSPPKTHVILISTHGTYSNPNNYKPNGDKSITTNGTHGDGIDTGTVKHIRKKEMLDFFESQIKAFILPDDKTTPILLGYDGDSIQGNNTHPPPPTQLFLMLLNKLLLDEYTNITIGQCQGLGWGNPDHFSSINESIDNGGMKIDGNYLSKPTEIQTLLSDETKHINILHINPETKQLDTDFKLAKLDAPKMLDKWFKDTTPNQSDTEYTIKKKSESTNLFTFYNNEFYVYYADGSNYGGFKDKDTPIGSTAGWMQYLNQNYPNNYELTIYYLGINHYVITIKKPKTSPTHLNGWVVLPNKFMLILMIIYPALQLISLGPIHPTHPTSPPPRKLMH